MIITYNVEKI